MVVVCAETGGKRVDASNDEWREKPALLDTSRYSVPSMLRSSSSKVQATIDEPNNFSTQLVWVVWKFLHRVDPAEVQQCSGHGPIFLPVGSRVGGRVPRGTFRARFTAGGGVLRRPFRVFLRLGFGAGVLRRTFRGRPRWVKPITQAMEMASSAHAPQAIEPQRAL